MRLRAIEHAHAYAYGCTRYSLALGYGANGVDRSEKAFFRRRVGMRSWADVCSTKNVLPKRNTQRTTKAVPTGAAPQKLHR